MKKYIMIFVLEISVVSTAMAATWTKENCTDRGGTVVSITGGTFCRSNITMNWWSANVWCQKHGGKLAGIADLCPGTAPAAGQNCPDLFSCYWNVWSSDTAASGQVLSFSGSCTDGHIYNINQSDLKRAICK